MDTNEANDVLPVLVKEMWRENRTPIDNLPADMIERVFSVAFTLKANAEDDPDQPWTFFDHKAGQVDAEAIMAGWQCGIIRLAVALHRETGVTRFMARPRLIGDE